MSRPDDYIEARRPENAPAHLKHDAPSVQAQHCGAILVDVTHQQFCQALRARRPGIVYNDNLDVELV